jgi:hypothetical protein
MDPGAATNGVDGDGDEEEEAEPIIAKSEGCEVEETIEWKAAPRSSSSRCGRSFQRAICGAARIAV